MDIIEQTFRRGTAVESIKVALVGTACVIIGMWLHLEAIFFSALMCISVRLFYRHYTWQRCLSGLGAAAAHMLAVLLVIFVANGHFSIMMLGLCVYLFVCAFLNGIGKPALETVFLAMFTPYIYITAMTAPERLASATTYWAIQMLMGFLAMLMLGVFSKPSSYKHALERRGSELLHRIVHHLSAVEGSVAIDSAVFDRYAKQIHEIYSADKDREIFWMNTLLWMRNVSALVLKFNRCYRTLRGSDECKDIMLSVNRVRAELVRLLGVMGAILLHQSRSLRFVMYDLNSQLDQLSHQIDQLRDGDAWQAMPAATQLVLGEVVSASRLMAQLLLEWSVFYKDSGRKLKGFTFLSAFNNDSLLMPSIFYALKLVAAFCIAVLVYRYFSPIIPSQFIATVLIISIEINLVSTLRKAAMRVAGSLLGLGLAIIGLSGYAHFSSITWLLMYVFFILLIAAYCCRPDAKYPYAGAMIAVMSLVVMLNSAGLATEVNFIVNRSEGILCGIAVAVFVALLFWSYKPQRTVLRQFALVMRQINALNAQVFFSDGGDIAPDRYRSRRLAIEGMLTSLRVLLLDYQRLVLPRHYADLQTMVEILERYFLIISASLQACVFMTLEQRQAMRDLLGEQVESIQRCYDQLAVDLRSGDALQVQCHYVETMQASIHAKLNQGVFRRLVPGTVTSQRSVYAIIVGHQLLLSDLLVKLYECVIDLQLKDACNEQTAEQ